jgi:hypothetical protein
VLRSRHKLPILHGPDIIGRLSSRSAVRNQQYGFVKALNERSKEGDDLGPVLGIQIAGRLIGENDLGLMHDRSRNRNTLLFPA